MIRDQIRRFECSMNFDFADLPMKFVIATNGDIRTFHLAFERTFGDMSFFVNTAGMNDKGALCRLPGIASWESASAHKNRSRPFYVRSL